MYDFLFGNCSKKKNIKRLSKKPIPRPSKSLVDKAKKLGIGLTVIRKGCKRTFKTNQVLRNEIRLKLKKCKKCKKGFKNGLFFNKKQGLSSITTTTSTKNNDTSYYSNSKLRLLHDFIKIEEEREILEQNSLAIKAKQEVLETNLAISKDNNEKIIIKNELNKIKNQTDDLKKSSEQLIKAENEFIKNKIQEINNEPPKQVLVKTNDSLKLVNDISKISTPTPIIKVIPPPPPMPPKKIALSLPMPMSYNNKKMLALPPPPKKTIPVPPPMPPKKVPPPPMPMSYNNNKKMLALPPPPKKMLAPVLPSKGVNLDKFKKSVKKIINTNIPKKEPKTWDLVCKGKSRSDIELFGLEYANPSKYASREELSKLKTKALLLSHPDKGCPGKSEWMSSLGPKPNTKEGCSKTLNSILSAYRNINKNCVI
jgi:hypothetical protein